MIINLLFSIPTKYVYPTLRLILNLLFILFYTSTNSKKINFFCKVMAQRFKIYYLLKLFSTDAILETKKKTISSCAILLAPPFYSIVLGSLTVKTNE